MMILKRVFTLMKGIFSFLKIPLLMTILCILCTHTYADNWNITIHVSNFEGICDTVYFGIHPEGTYGLDTQLGEVNLPPAPPLSVFDLRFLITGYEGFELDIRDTTHTERIHHLKWQAGDGGYPVTVRWSKESIPPGIFRISDSFGGVIIPEINMKQDSIVIITGDQYFITSLHIRVIPEYQASQPPEIQDLPEQKMFSGQRFPFIQLNCIVTDPDTPIDQLNWIVEAQSPLNTEITLDNELIVSYPYGWIGSSSIDLTVYDPEQNMDTQQIHYTSKEPGVVRYSLPILIEDAGDGSGTVCFGIDPDGTTGLDPDLGEVNLPPVPPQGTFDVRSVISSSFSSLIDIREMNEIVREHTLSWQTSDAGYPVTISWDSEIIPHGDFFISDIMGGIFIPQTNMKTTSEIIIPNDQSFITDLLIEVTPEIDTLQPIGPHSLWIVSNKVTYNTIELGWTQAYDYNFDYYEILYDTHPFIDNSEFVWDYNNDPLLTEHSTLSTIIDIADLGNTIFWAIRAWDTYGNTSDVVYLYPDLEIKNVSCCIENGECIISWEDEGIYDTFKIYRDLEHAYFTISEDTLIDTTVNCYYSDSIGIKRKAFYRVVGVIDD